MDTWEDLKKEFYRKKVRLYFLDGVIDFSPNSMKDVKNGSFKSYDEYLEIQKNSLNRQRVILEHCYYHAGLDDCYGQIERRGRNNDVLFRKIIVNYWEGNGIPSCINDKVEHVWITSPLLKNFHEGDRLKFHASVYRYMKHGHNGKQIDYGLCDPEGVLQISDYRVPTDEELKDRDSNLMIESFLCETCLYSEQCLGNGVCLANQSELAYNRKVIKDLAQLLNHKDLNHQTL